MIFYCLFIILLTISTIKNNQIDYPKSDSKGVPLDPDNITKLSNELTARLPTKRKGYKPNHPRDSGGDGGNEDH